MKKILLILIITLFSCSNDDDVTNRPLPNLTFEGNNTFGCIIDGINYQPVTRDLDAKYLFLERDAPNGYWFSINADNRNLNKFIRFERNLSNIPLEEGIYSFGNQENGVLNASYSIIGDVIWNDDGSGYQLVSNYVTTNETDGELEIIKLDENEKIISGTFWFDCIDSAGNVVEIRDGRFDLKYETN